MRTLLLTIVVSLSSVTAFAQSGSHTYTVLATSKTSTMEKEMNQAADAGYEFAAVMGGETAFGGNEVVVVMRKSEKTASFKYKLLATNRTSTMQREMLDAASLGFDYVGQTVFRSAFGGDEVVVIMQRDPAKRQSQFEYTLVATSRTSTLEKELNATGATGYEVIGLTVGRTAMGGAELVAIARRPRR